MENKLSKGSNLMWEGSRFILPEHREAILNLNKEKLKKIRPQLDEQKLEEFSYVINESMTNGSTVILTEFDDIKDNIIKGKITRLDQQLKRIKIENENEVYWIPLMDIVQMEIE